MTLTKGFFPFDIKDPSYTSPVAFGGVGNGVGDDQTAFTDMFAAASDGTVVDLLGRTYVINSSSGISGVGVDVNGINDLVIRNGKIIVPDGSGLARPFVVRNSTGFRAENVLFISLESGANPVNGLDLMNVNDATVTKCGFIGQTFYGLGVYEDTIDAVEAQCNNLQVFDNLFMGVGTIGFEAFPKVKSDIQRVERNAFISCGKNIVGAGNGTAFKAGQGYVNSIIHNNLVIDCGLGALSFGASITNWDNCEFTENRFIDCKRSSLAISVAPHSGSLGQEGNYNSLVVSGNKFIRSLDFSYGAFVADYAIALSHGNTTTYVANNGTIVIENNFFNRYYGAVETRGADDLPNLHVISNKTFRMESASFFFRDDDGGFVTNPVFLKNEITNYNLARITIEVIFEGATSVVFGENIFTNSGEYAARFTNLVTEANIFDNKFINGNVTAIASRAAISLVGTNVATYRLAGNKIYGGIWVALILSPSANHTLIASNNDVPRVATNSTPTITGTPLAGIHTTQGDAAVNGYVSVKDFNGTTRKLATIA